MRLIEGLNRFISTYIDTIKGFVRFKVVFPMFLFAVIQAFVLWMLINFYRPPFDGILIPIITKFFDESYTHYPTLYTMLSSVFRLVNYPLNFLLGTLLSGMTVFLFASYFEDEGLSICASFKATITRYPILLLLWIVETAIVLGLVTVVSQQVNHLVYSLKREIIYRLLLSGLGSLAVALFAYAVPAVVLTRTSFIKAITSSLRIFKENFFTTFFLIFIPVMVRFPIDFFNSKSGQLTGKFNPEFIAILMGIGLFFSLIAYLLLIGGVTRIYISESR